MKIKYINILLLTVLLNLSAFGQTNSVSPTNSTSQTIIQTVKSTVATNINQVVVEMLSGTKDAAAEIYGASKTALKNSVDFVVEQAPDVVKQFLMWKFFEAVTSWSLWAAFSLFLFIISLKLHFYMKSKKKERLAKTPDSVTTSDYEDTACFFKWVTRAISILVLLLATSEYGFTIVEIKVAPKYYLITYVVDQVQSVHIRR